MGFPDQIRHNKVELLKKELLRLQGLRGQSNAVLDQRLGPIAAAFPNGSFPLGAIHEFVSAAPETSAVTSGFMFGVLSTLMTEQKLCMWISHQRRVFPPSLTWFGIAPERIIFLDVSKEQDVLWAVDEALKCKGLSAVVGEVKDLDFTASRRLQLAVEQSMTTGFILRNNLKKLNTTACVSRWKLSSLASEAFEDLPGIGLPKWHVELLRIRNGRPGSWNVQWRNGAFESEFKHNESEKFQQKNAG